MDVAKLNSYLAEYNDLVCTDPHKDIDCHFNISFNRDYGQPIGWFIHHSGYVNELPGKVPGILGPYPSFKEASNVLENFLFDWIGEEIERRPECW